MNAVLKEIFDSSGGFGEIQRFCEEFEGYREAKEALNAWYDKLEKALGYEEVCEIEDTFLRCCYWENQAYYAFGLHVREELRRALML